MTDDLIQKAKALTERIEAARLKPTERRAKSLRAGLLDVLRQHDLPLEVMEAASAVLGIPLFDVPKSTKKPREREKAVHAEAFARMLDGHPEPGKFALTPAEMQRRAGVTWTTTKRWQCEPEFHKAVEDQINAWVEGVREALLGAGLGVDDEVRIDLNFTRRRAA